MPGPPRKASKSERLREAEAIEMYREWADHRYDPGYYLGGRILPFLRRTDANRRGRRLHSPVLAFIGLTTILGAVSWGTDAEPGVGRLTVVFTLAIGVLEIAAAWKLRGNDLSDKAQR